MDLAKDIKEGLQEDPKRIPSTYFYDEKGSQLFQKIMKLDEYYLTRAEQEILDVQADQISKQICQSVCPTSVIELGAGDASKTRSLLKKLMQRMPSLIYRPTDVDRFILQQASLQLKAHLPSLSVHPIVGLHKDIMPGLAKYSPKLILFLGSNIGNYTQTQSLTFISHISRIMAPGDQLLLGLDRRKNPHRILSAYNDAKGITAQFNLNVLRRINRELQANFDLSQFLFYPTYQLESGEVRSYLVSKTLQTVDLPAIDLSVQFAPWEFIHTEISRKHDQSDIETFCELGHFQMVGCWTDQEEDFWDVLFQKQ